MADFIQMMSDALDALLAFFNNLADGLAIVWTACGNVIRAVPDAVQYFPSAIGGIIVTSCCLLVVLRIVGR